MKSTNLSLFVLTLLVTGLNALKPIHIDDANIYGNALQLAHHPTDPFGYQTFWFQWPEPAAWMLVPPGVPYWWSLAIRLFGDSVVMWKVWQGAWIACLVFALHRLFRRFAPGLEIPLVWMTALSSTFLPAVNMMLDVPAVAMGMVALSLGVAAIDRGSVWRAIAAGLAAGVAIETKYTAAVIPAAIFVYAMLHRRWWLAFLPGAVATGVFVAWETYTGHLYGMSQFRYALGWTDAFKGQHSHAQMALAIVTLIGGLAAPIGLLGLASLGAPTLIIAGAAAALVIGYAALLMAVTATPVFVVAGVANWVVVLLVARRLAQKSDRDDLFLLVWFCLEIVGFFAISPFAAARRVMALTVVMTFMVGRVASRAQLMQRRPVLARGIVAGGILLGAGFFTLDWLESIAHPRAVAQAAAVIEPQRQSGQTVWFTGHWGMQFYSLRRGYVPVVPDHSTLRAGDWFIEALPNVSRQHLDLTGAPLRFIADFAADDAVPLNGIFYYGGLVPVEHRDAPRLALRLWRVEADFVPSTPDLPDMLATWAASQHRPLAPDSVRAVLHAATKVSTERSTAAIDAIVHGGVGAIEEARRLKLQDPDPAVRAAAAQVVVRVVERGH